MKTYYEALMIVLPPCSDRWVITSVTSCKSNKASLLLKVAPTVQNSNGEAVKSAVTEKNVVFDGFISCLIQFEFSRVAF